MKTARARKVLLAVFISVLGFLTVGSIFSASNPLNFPIQKTVINGDSTSISFTLTQSTPVYYLNNGGDTPNGYFRIKRDGVVGTYIDGQNWPAGNYEIEFKAGSVNSSGGFGGSTYYGGGEVIITMTVMVVFNSCGSINNCNKVAYCFSKAGEDAHSFTLSANTKVCYEYYYEQGLGYNGYFAISDGTNNVVYINGNNGGSGCFQGKAGKTYTVKVLGGYQGQSFDIPVPGAGGMWCNDTLPIIVMESSKRDKWIKGGTGVNFDLKATLTDINIEAPLATEVHVAKVGEPDTWCSSKSTGNTAQFYWPISSSTGINGNYHALVKVYQGNSFIMQSDYINFNIDNIAPTFVNAAISPPSSGGTYYQANDTPVTISYTASDANSGLDKIETHITGNSEDLSPAGLNSLNGITAKTGTIIVNLPQTTGSYTISITASDKAGNQSAPLSFSINIDTAGPIFNSSLTAAPVPTYLTYTNAGQVTYSWAPSTDPNLKEYYIRIESGSDGNNWVTDLDWTLKDKQTTHTYVVPAGSNGKKIKATVKAVNIAGNETTISKTITIDQSVPDPTLPSYAVRFKTSNVPNTGKFIFTWNPVNDNINGISDSGSGVSRYDTAITMTDTPPSTALIASEASGSTSRQFTGVFSDQSYYLWIRAVDKAGNTGNWTKAGPFPDFNVTGPKDNQTVSTAGFSAAPRESLGAGKELRFKLYYKYATEASYHSYPGDYQTAEITPNLADGTWNWYLEIAEFQNGTMIPDSHQTTEIFTFTMNHGGNVGLPLFFTTPGATLQLSATVVNSANITNYHWNLGDGTIIDGLDPAPEHIYPSQLDYHETEPKYYKEYQLALTVTYSDRSPETVNSTVMVQNTQTGTLFTDEIWGGTHDIYGTITVPDGKTLTILPGTQVIVHRNPGETGYNTALIINGTLGVQTWACFSSSAGTLNNGWKGIFINGTAIFASATIRHALCGMGINNNAGVTVNNCIIENNNIGIHVYKSSPSLTNTIIRNNLWYGIKEDDIAAPTITGCIFSGNGINYYNTNTTRTRINDINGNTEQ